MGAGLHGLMAYGCGIVPKYMDITLRRVRQSGRRDVGNAPDGQAHLGLTANHSLPLTPFSSRNIPFSGRFRYGAARFAKTFAGTPGTPGGRAHRHSFSGCRRKETTAYGLERRLDFSGHSGVAPRERPCRATSWTPATYPPQGHRAPRAPLSSTGRRLQGPGEPHPLPAEMLFASPLQAPFSGHIFPGFSPRFCDQMKQVIARWNPAPIPELPGSSRNFPHRGLRRTAPTAKYKLSFSVSRMFSPLPPHPPHLSATESSFKAV